MMNRIERKAETRRREEEQAASLAELEHQLHREWQYQLLTQVAPSKDDSWVEVLNEDDAEGQRDAA
jgi:hypothetical protein